MNSWHTRIDAPPRQVVMYGIAQREGAMAGDPRRTIEDAHAALGASKAIRQSVGRSATAVRAASDALSEVIEASHSRLAESYRLLREPVYRPPR